MSRREVAPTFRVDVFIAGDFDIAKQVCRRFCYEHGLCVTVEPVAYIYTGAEEAGVRVGLINYPRFPSTPDRIVDLAVRLADALMRELVQHSYSVVTPENTVFYSRRDA